MDRKIKIMGTKLRTLTADYVSEFMEQVLEGEQLVKFQVVTKDMLVYAVDHDTFREELETMHIHVLDDPDIMAATRHDTSGSKKNADRHSVYRGLLEKAEELGKNLCCLTKTAEEADLLMDAIATDYPALPLMGCIVCEGILEDPDQIVNEINMALPDIVISLMDQPFQTWFIHEQSDKIDTRVIFGLARNEGAWDDKKSGWLRKTIEKFSFMQRVQQYNDSK